MGNPYVGEIRMFGGNFAPAGWFFCNGQTLPISQYDTLYALIGTTYGGNGTTTFNLPDLQGRIPLHFGPQPGGPTYIQGQAAGEENHTLILNEIPAHTHQVNGMGAGTTNVVTNNLWGGGGLSAFKAGTPAVAMNAAVVQNAGGNVPHENMMPFLVVSFIIAWEGIFPSRS